MFNKSRKFRLFLCYSVMALSFLFCAPNTAVAANSYFNIEVTPEERAVFAFFRIANSYPDYERWIKSSTIYKSSSPAAQENFLLKETLRLGRGYGNYDSVDGVLEIKVNVLAKYIPATDDEQSRITFEFFDQRGAYVPSFNYDYAGDVISLIINNLAGFSDLSLTKEHSKALLAKIPYKEESFDATLTIHTRVSRADLDRPVKNKDFMQWVMIGDIAYLKCDVNQQYSPQISVLWDYVAPWYEESFRIKNIPEEDKYPHPYDLFKD